MTGDNLFGVRQELHYDHLGQGIEDLLQLEPCLSLPSQLATAVTKRQREHLAGRLCAARCLALLGKSPLMIPIGKDREPVWPEGLVGSITHTAGYAAAWVGLSSFCWGIGIDTEQRVAHAKEGLKRYIFGAREWERCSEQSGFDSELVFTLVFSAKESLYKCLYPHCRTFFGFQDAEVSRIDPVAGQLTLQLGKSLPNIQRSEFVADYWIGGNLIHTQVHVGMDGAGTGVGTERS